MLRVACGCVVWIGFVLGCLICWLAFASVGLLISGCVVIICVLVCLFGYCWFCGLWSVDCAVDVVWGVSGYECSGCSC